MIKTFLESNQQDVLKTLVQSRFSTRTYTYNLQFKEEGDFKRKKDERKYEWMEQAVLAATRCFFWLPKIKPSHDHLRNGYYRILLDTILF